VKIAIANLKEDLYVDQEELRELLAIVLQGEGKKRARVSVALVDDKTIAELNKKYLGRRGPTDVLAFPYDEGPQSKDLGEIVISVDTARKVARRRKKSIKKEIYLYALHGLLHLLGYDHNTQNEARKMRKKEIAALATL
jgi:probable rRNA maturation factor